MAVFRVEKNSGYTVMSNHHLRNRALSLKAKGLLSQMLSLPEDWDYTLQGLARINRESIDAIRQAIRELEQAGYIQRSRERDEKGRLRGADYVIFELPQPVPASVSPTLENPTLENPTQENPTLENPMQLNRQSAQPVVSDPCGGPDHEHPVYLHLPCDLWPHDRDLRCDRAGAYPACHHGQQRVAQHRAELFEIAFGVRFSSVPDYDCRGHLRGADTQHFGRGGHCRGYLGLHGLYRSALLLFVQDRQHQQICVRCPLRKERLNGVCDRSQRFDPCKIQSLIRADQAATSLLRRCAFNGRAALFFDPELSFQQRGSSADDFCYAAGAAVRSVRAARPAP